MARRQRLDGAGISIDDLGPAIAYLLGRDGQPVGGWVIIAEVPGPDGELGFASVASSGIQARRADLVAHWLVSMISSLESEVNAVRKIARGWQAGPDRDYHASAADEILAAIGDSSG